MKMDADLIYQQLRNLINESCADSNKETFRDFHREFLKLHFGAMDVKIDYDKKSIFVWSPKPIEAESFSIQNIFKSITKKIEYDDLEATLCGCLEENDLYLRFYHYFLIEYSSPKLAKKTESSSEIAE